MYEIVNKRKLFELEIEQLGVTFHFGCYIVRYVSDLHLQLRITNLYIYVYSFNCIYISYDNTKIKENCMQVLYAFGK